MIDEPSPPKRFVFAAIGGSGSSYLISALSRRYEVGDRPDTVFRALIEDLHVGTGNAPDQATFEERSHGCRLPDGCTFEEAMRRYLAFIAAFHRRTAVFNTAPEQGIFSLLRVPNVVFLVRDPIDAYVSWTKPERHERSADALGGVFSPDAVDFYVRRWNRLVAEYESLRRLGLAPGLVRYDSAVSDATPLGLAWAFRELRSERRNRGILPSSLEEQITQMTADGFATVWGRAPATSSVRS